MKRQGTGVLGPQICRITPWMPRAILFVHQILPGFSGGAEVGNICQKGAPSKRSPPPPPMHIWMVYDGAFPNPFQRRSILRSSFPYIWGSDRQRLAASEDPQRTRPEQHDQILPRGERRAGTGGQAAPPPRGPG